MNHRNKDRLCLRNAGYPTDIDRFIIPLLDPPKQVAIGDLVRNSLEKQKESKRLLGQVKYCMEQLIEEASEG